MGFVELSAFKFGVVCGSVGTHSDAETKIPQATAWSLAERLAIITLLHEVFVSRTTANDRELQSGSAGA